MNHSPTWQSITAERAFLSALGGGCRSPIAALGAIDGATLKLDGMVADINGKRVLRASEGGTGVAPEVMGAQLARKMLALGASEFITEARVG